MIWGLGPSLGPGTSISQLKAPGTLAPEVLLSLLASTGTKLTSTPTHTQALT